VRGATHAVWSLGEEEAARGVVTHSSGNHGAALARAAVTRGIPCRVVMPRGAARAKREAVLAQGAEVVECAPTQAAREETTARLLAETGAALVHPYDDARVIAGQGTCARELFEDAAALDLLLAPLGGGGLLSGTLLAAAALSPRTRVVGVEPAGADDARRSLAAGTIVPVAEPRTIADGLRATLGALPFAVLRAHRCPVVTVTDEEILESMRLLWERLKVVVEPSAAVPLAAVLAGRVEAAGRRVGVILSGGNLDLPAQLFAGSG
jgi:threonine dehydratase